MNEAEIRKRYENDFYHYPLTALNEKEIEILGAFEECMELYGKKAKPGPSPASLKPFKTYMIKYECLNPEGGWQAFMTYKFYPRYKNRRGQIMVETLSNLNKAIKKEWDEYWLEDIDFERFKEAFRRTLIAFNRVSRSSEGISSYEDRIEAIVRRSKEGKSFEKPRKKEELVTQQSGSSIYPDKADKTNMGFANLYESVVSCPEACQGVLRDNHTNIPRGFFTQANSKGKVLLLLIAQNPGQPMKDHGEWQLYKDLTPEETVKAHLNFGKNCFVDGHGKTFHNRLNSWICELLDVTRDRAFNFAVYSNAVKCTTPNNKAPQSSLVTKCVKLHLLREIDFWMPKLVIALGSNAQRYMRLCGISHEVLLHPSHRKQADYHKPFLENIRKKIMRFEVDPL